VTMVDWKTINRKTDEGTRRKLLYDKVRDASCLVFGCKSRIMLPHMAYRTKSTYFLVVKVSFRFAFDEIIINCYLLGVNKAHARPRLVSLRGFPDHFTWEPSLGEDCIDQD